MDGPRLTTVVMIGGGLDNDNDPGMDGDPSGVVDTIGFFSSEVLAPSSDPGNSEKSRSRSSVSSVLTFLLFFRLDGVLGGGSWMSELLLVVGLLVCLDSM
jgi:hypothetical protein